MKSRETKEGVCFRILRDNKFVFLNVPFQNYFYVKHDDYLTHEEDCMSEFQFCIDRVEKVGQFAKIILRSNWMRNRVKKFWEKDCNTFEADIKANKRFLLDKSPPLNNTMIPYTFYDIETDDRKPLKKDERGNIIPLEDARILSFAATDWKGEQVYFELIDDDDIAEKILLNEIMEYFAKYGIISGWNSEKFDMPYIKGRCDRLGVSYLITDYLNHLDYMDLFKKYDKKSRKQTCIAKRFVLCDI